MQLTAYDLGLMGAQDESNDTLQQLDLSGTLSDVAHRALRLVEKKKIFASLAANGGHKSKTAEDLGISYKTLLTKLRDYSL
ncbi:MAG: helix-turn-helix domain-containing protein [Pyrinomonadaceae bacterium]